MEEAALSSTTINGAVVPLATAPPHASPKSAPATNPTQTANTNTVPSTLL